MNELRRKLQLRHYYEGYTAVDPFSFAWLWIWEILSMSFDKNGHPMHGTTVWVEWCNYLVKN
jgi:hypothetical protein